jgi:DNA-binding CsgD family transcriptional regulator
MKAVHLTERQTEVLRLTMRGYGAREAGVELGISESAVRKHLIVLRQKLKAGRKRQLIEAGHRLGLLNGREG